MARIKGVAPFAANFESEKAAPLVDMYCETIADMISANEQKAHDGASYLYYGRKAIVFNNTADSSKNGTYELINSSAPTVIASWRFLSGAVIATDSIVVANPTALLAEKTANRMAVKQWYIITSLNIEIQIKFKSPDGNFFYEKIDNDGVIEIVKVE